MQINQFIDVMQRGAVLIWGCDLWLSTSG